MRKKISIGIGDYFGRMEHGYVDIELKMIENCGLQFSASGGISDKIGGQCLETLAKIFPDNETLKEILPIWKEYHLNGLEAGIECQRIAVDTWLETNKYDYDKICEYLKGLGIYDAKIPEGQKFRTRPQHPLPTQTCFCKNSTEIATLFDNGIYRYGSGWAFRPIPEDILAKIQKWFN